MPQPILNEGLQDVVARHDGTRIYMGSSNRVNLQGSGPYNWRPQSEYFTEHAKGFSVELGTLQTRLDALRGALAGGPAELTDWLEQGRAGTRRIPGKHGGAATEWARLVVEIPDAPNALGRLFTDIGDAGLNVEDITIEHDPTRKVGYLSLDVEADTRDTLAALLADAGWSVEAAGR